MLVVGSLSLLIALAAPLAPAAALPRAITFDEALGLAERSPSVVGARRAEAEKRRLDASVPGVPYNPQLFLQPGYRIGPRENRDWELQVGLSQGWNLERLGRKRKEAMGAEQEVLAAEARALSLSRRLAAARAWLDLWAVQQVLEEVQREDQAAQEFLRLVERGQAAMELTRADLADANTYRAEARLLRLGVEGEMYERRIELARELAQAAGAVDLVAIGDLPEPRLPVEGEWLAWVARVEALPVVVVNELRARSTRARAVEERAARGTHLSTGVYFQRDAPLGLVISATASLTLPIVERGQREISVMRAEAERQDGQARQAALDAAADLALAFHEVRHTGEVLAEVRDRLAPSSRESAELHGRLFHAGEATVFEVLQVRRVALDAMGRFHRARAAYTWSRMRTWLLLAAIEQADSGPKRARTAGAQ